MAKKKTIINKYFGPIESDAMGSFARIDWEGTKTTIEIDCPSDKVEWVLNKAASLVQDQKSWSKKAKDCVAIEVKAGRIDFLLSASDRKPFLASLEPPTIRLSQNDQGNDVDVCFSYFSSYPKLQVPDEITPYAFWLLGAVESGFLSLEVHGGD